MFHETSVFFGSGETQGQDPFFDLAKVIFERYDNSFSIDWKNKKSGLN